jgi:hypothetical protein
VDRNSITTQSSIKFPYSHDALWRSQRTD